MSAQRALPSSWLHDDAEEDLVGADWHQRAIRALSDSLDDLARQAGDLDAQAQTISEQARYIADLKAELARLRGES